jgi:hypothetical protein
MFATFPGRQHNFNALAKRLVGDQAFLATVEAAILLVLEAAISPQEG